MKRLKLIFTAFAAVTIFFTAKAQVTGVTPLPSYPDTLGVSAPFAGYVGGTLLVAGGCNFPDCPAAEGGKKVFYRHVYALDDAAGAAWRLVGAMPRNLAYGASVETPEGLLCIGGSGKDGATADVFLLKFTNNGLQTTSLPSLPVTLTEGGAALIGHTVYAVGGRQGDGGNGLYALNINRPTAWQKLASFPGTSRLQPSVVAVGDRLFLIGGYAFDAEKNRCTLADKVLAYDPQTDRWMRETQLPKSGKGKVRGAVGATATVVGETIVMTGGVNPDIFKHAVEGIAGEGYLLHPAEWYAFNGEVLVYDVQSRKWSKQKGDIRLARAGGVLLHHAGRFVMVCGEKKPGVRSPLVTTFRLQ